MKTPAPSAAAMRNWPAATSTSWPSRVMCTVDPGSARGAVAWCDVTTGSAMGAASVLHVHQEFVAEHADARGDRRRDGRPQHADGGLLRWPAHARGQVVAHVHEQIQIALEPGAVLDAAQDVLEPAARLATRGALTARLAAEEARDAPGGAHGAG